MRLRMSSRLSALAVGGLPSISTLPPAPEKPRTSLSPPSKVKPGSRATMSQAVLGWADAKNAAG